MPTFVRIASVSALPPGGRIVADINDEWIAVFNVGGKLYAVEDRCSHDDGPLIDGEIDEDELSIMCPRHGAQFDLKTGKVLSMPATQPIRWFEVKADGDDVLVAV